MSRRGSFRRSSIPRGGRPLRGMDWGGIHFPAAAAVSSLGGGTGAGFYIFAPTDVRTYYSDPTLMRLLINVNLAGSGTGHISWGVIAWDDVNDVADDIPNPYHNPNLDWIVTGNASGFAATHYTHSGVGGAWIESRAKRRLGNNKGLLFSILNITASAVDYTMAARYLIKE